MVKQKKHLRLILNVAVGFFVILAVAVIAYLYINSVERNVQNETSQYLDEVCVQGAARIKEKFDGALEDLVSMVNVIGQTDFALDDPRIIESLGLEAASTAFQNASVVLPDGTAYEKLNGETFRFYAGDREYFKQSMAGMNYISEPFIPADGADSAIAVSVPVYRGGSIIGVLVGRYNLNDLTELLDINIFDGRGYSYMANSDGKVFIPSNHEGTDKSLKNLSTDFSDAKMEDPHALQTLSKNMLEGKKGNIAYERNGTRRVMSYTPIGVNDWYLLTVMPNEVVAGKTSQLIRQAAIFCGILLTIFALVVIYFFNAEYRKKEALRKAHQDLKTAKQRYDIVLSQSNDIVFEWNILDKSIYYSDLFKKRMGYTPKTENFPQCVIKENQIYKGDEVVFSEIFNNIEQGKPYAEGEVRIVTAGGQAVWHRVRVSLVLDEDGLPTRGVGVLADIDAEVREKEKIIEAAEKDSLTSLYNKGAAEEKIQDWLAEYGNSHLGAMMVVDVDDFKNINDTFGHMAGDCVLREITEKIAKIFRESDVFGRIGGDEFMILMKDIQSRKAVAKKAQEIIKIYEAYRLGREKTYTVSCSIGISFCPDDGRTFGELYKKADQALYYAKEHGKNRFAFYENKK